MTSIQSSLNYYSDREIHSFRGEDQPTTASTSSFDADSHILGKRKLDHSSEEMQKQIKKIREVDHFFLPTPVPSTHLIPDHSTSLRHSFSSFEKEKEDDENVFQKPLPLMDQFIEKMEYSDQIGLFSQNSSSEIQVLEESAKKALKKHVKWSDDEENQLIKARQTCGTDWESIAKFLPGRTQTQCREKYRNLKECKDPRINLSAISKTVKKKGKRKEWSHEEENQLIEARQKPGSLWENIVKLFPERTISQCIKKYHLLKKKEDSRINPRAVSDKTSKKWSHDEKIQLIKARQTFGSDWDSILKLFPGRTKNQCKQLDHRLRKLKDPRINPSAISETAKKIPRKQVKWSHDEEIQLIKARQTFGSDWDSILKLFPGRTQIQCQQKYIHLEKCKDPRIELIAIYEKDIRINYAVEKTTHVVQINESTQDNNQLGTFSQNSFRTESLSSSTSIPTNENSSSEIQVLKGSTENVHRKKKKKNVWSNHEENQLIVARQNGVKWKNIVKFVPGRTKRQCQKKFLYLKSIKKDPRINLIASSEKDIHNSVEKTTRVIDINDYFNESTENNNQIGTFSQNSSRTENFSSSTSIPTTEKSSSEIQVLEESAKKVLKKRVKWSDDEENQLINARKFDDNWDNIAKLFPGRTKTQCQSKYFHLKRKKDPRIDLIALSDKDIHNSVEKTTRVIDINDYFNESTEDNNQLGTFSQNSSHTESLSSSTPIPASENLSNETHVLESSVEKVHRKKNKKIQWSFEEEGQLIKARQQMGVNWEKISKLFTGRTKGQCSTKYRILKEKNDPRINLEPMLVHEINMKWTAWSPEEENRLIEARQKCGSKWKDVAKLVPRRTEEQCRLKYRRLKENKDPRINLVEK